MLRRACSLCLVFQLALGDCLFWARSASAGDFLAPEARISELSREAQNLEFSRLFFRKEALSDLSVADRVRDLARERGYLDFVAVPLVRDGVRLEGSAVALLGRDGEASVYHLKNTSGGPEAVLAFRGKAGGKRLNLRELSRKIRESGEGVEERIAHSLEIRGVLRELEESGSDGVRSATAEEVETEALFRELLDAGMEAAEGYSLAEFLLHECALPREEARGLAVGAMVNFHALFAADALFKGVEFEDPSRMYVAPRDQNRWVRETLKWLRSQKNSMRGPEDPRWKEAVFKAFYMGAVSNYIENVDPDQLDAEGKNLRLQAKRGFLSVFGKWVPPSWGPDEFVRLQKLEEWDSGLISPGATSLAFREPKKMAQMRAQVRHARFSGESPMFVKDSEGGEVFEGILREELENEGAVFVPMPLGPYTDRTQILGGLLPARTVSFWEAWRDAEEASDEDLLRAIQIERGIPKSEMEEAGPLLLARFKEVRGKLGKVVFGAGKKPVALSDGEIEKSLTTRDLARHAQMLRMVGAYLKTGVSGQGVLFHKGDLIRVFEAAHENPGQKFAVYLDNVDGTEAKVRNGIFNHLLEKGEVEVNGYRNPKTGDSRLVLPKNVQLVFSCGKKGGVEDRALFNRLQKYALPQMDVESRVDFEWEREETRKVKWSGGEKDRIVRAFQAFETFCGENEIPFHTSLVSHFFERLRGLAPDSPHSVSNLLSRELGILLLHRLPNAELEDEFRKTLISLGFQGYEKPSYRFDETGDLFVDGVGLELCEELKAQIRGTANDEEKEILLKNYSHGGSRKSGIVLTSQSLRMLSSVVRNVRFNNRVIQVLGPTGVGKTFTGEGLAIARGLPYASEPVHKRMDLDAWTGFYEVSPSGEFVFRSDTEFRRLFSEGGGVMLSELNAKGDFRRRAYMSWVLNGIAKEHRLTFPVNRSGDPMALTETLERHPEHFLILDMNPASSYGNRYPLNEELDSVTGVVSVNGDFSADDYRKLIRMRLLEERVTLPAETLALVGETLSEAHEALARMLRREGLLQEADQTVLTLRELLDQAIGSVLTDAARGERDPLAMIQKALRNYYLSFWTDPEEQAEAAQVVAKILRKRPEFKGKRLKLSVDRHDEKAVRRQLDEIVAEGLEGAGLGLRRVPSLHLRFAVDSDGEGLVEAWAEEKNAARKGPRWRYERKDLSAFTDTYDLKGDYAPGRSGFTELEAEGLLREYEKLPGGRERIQKIRGSLRKESGVENPPAMEILEEMRALELGKRWNPDLLWTEAFLVRKVREAEESLGKAGGDLSKADRVVVELAQYEQLHPEIAIMLNDFFLSGRLHLPGGKVIQAPANLVLIPTSTGKLKLSPAENSRQVRLSLYEYSDSRRGKLIEEALLEGGAFEKGSAELREARDRVLLLGAFFGGRDDVWGGLAEDNTANRAFAESLDDNGDYQEYLSRGGSVAFQNWRGIARMWGAYRGIHAKNPGKAWEKIEKEIRKMLGIPLPRADRVRSVHPLLARAADVESILDYCIAVRNDERLWGQKNIREWLQAKGQAGLREGAEALLNPANAIRKEWGALYALPRARTSVARLQVGDLVWIGKGFHLHLGDGLALGWDSRKRELAVTRLSPTQSFEFSAREHLDRELSRLFLEDKKKEASRANLSTHTVFGKLRHVLRLGPEERRGEEAFLRELFYPGDLETFSAWAEREQAFREAEPGQAGVYLSEGALVCVDAGGRASAIGAGRFEVLAEFSPPTGARFVPYAAFEKTGMRETPRDLLTESGVEALKGLSQAVEGLEAGENFLWWLENPRNRSFLDALLSGREGVSDTESLVRALKSDRAHALSMLRTLLADTLLQNGLNAATFQSSLHVDARLPERGSLGAFLEKVGEESGKLEGTDSFEAVALKPLFVRQKFLSEDIRPGDWLEWEGQVKKVKNFDGFQCTLEDGTMLRASQLEGVRKLALPLLEAYRQYLGILDHVEKILSPSATLNDLQGGLEALGLFLGNSQSEFFIHPDQPRWPEFLRKVFGGEAENLRERLSLQEVVQKKLAEIKKLSPRPVEPPAKSDDAVTERAILERMVALETENHILKGQIPGAEPAYSSSSEGKSVSILEMRMRFTPEFSEIGILHADGNRLFGTNETFIFELNSEGKFAEDVRHFNEKIHQAFAMGKRLFLATDNGVQVWVRSVDGNYGLDQSLGEQGIFGKGETFSGVLAHEDESGVLRILALSGTDLWSFSDHTASGSRVGSHSGNFVSNSMSWAEPGALDFLLAHDQGVVLRKLDPQTGEFLEKRAFESEKGIRQITRSGDGFYYATSLTTNEVFVLKREGDRLALVNTIVLELAQDNSVRGIAELDGKLFVSLGSAQGILWLEPSEELRRKLRHNEKEIARLLAQADSMDERNAYLDYGGKDHYVPTKAEESQIEAVMRELVGILRENKDQSAGKLIAEFNPKKNELHGIAGLASPRGQFFPIPEELKELLSDPVIKSKMSEGDLGLNLNGLDLSGVDLAGADRPFLNGADLRKAKNVGEMFLDLGAVHGAVFSFGPGAALQTRDERRPERADAETFDLDLPEVRKAFEEKGAVFFDSVSGPLWPQDNSAWGPAWEAFVRHQVREGVFEDEEAVKSWGFVMQSIERTILQAAEPVNDQKTRLVLGWLNGIWSNDLPLALRERARITGKALPLSEKFLEFLRRKDVQRNFSWLVGDVTKALDLSFLDLNDSNFEDAAWEGVKLNGADLRTCTLNPEEIGAAWLSGAKLAHGELKELEITGALSAAELTALQQDLESKGALFFNKQGFLLTTEGEAVNAYIDQVTADAARVLKRLQDIPEDEISPRMFNLEKKKILQEFAEVLNPFETWAEKTDGFIPFGMELQDALENPQIRSRLTYMEGGETLFSHFHLLELPPGFEDLKQPKKQISYAELCVKPEHYVPLKGEAAILEEAFRAWTELLQKAGGSDQKALVDGFNRIAEEKLNDIYLHVKEKSATLPISEELKKLIASPEVKAKMSYHHPRTHKIVSMGLLFLDLSGADLSGAKLPDLGHADLRGATLHGLEVELTGMVGARVDDSEQKVRVYEGLESERGIWGYNLLDFDDLILAWNAAQDASVIQKIERAKFSPVFYERGESFPREPSYEIPCDEFVPWWRAYLESWVREGLFTSVTDAGDWFRVILAPMEEALFDYLYPENSTQAELSLLFTRWNLGMHHAELFLEKAASLGIPLPVTESIKRHLENGTIKTRGFTLADTEMDFSWLDLRGVDFSNVPFGEYVRLEGTDLRGCPLEGAHLPISLTRVRLTRKEIASLGGDLNNERDDVVKVYETDLGALVFDEEGTLLTSRGGYFQLERDALSRRIQALVSQAEALKEEDYDPGYFELEKKKFLDRADALRKILEKKPAQPDVLPEIAPRGEEYRVHYTKPSHFVPETEAERELLEKTLGEMADWLRKLEDDRFPFEDFRKGFNDAYDTLEKTALAASGGGKTLPIPRALAAALQKPEIKERMNLELKVGEMAQLALGSLDLSGLDLAVSALTYIRGSDLRGTDLSGCQVSDFPMWMHPCRMDTEDLEDKISFMILSSSGKSLFEKHGGDLREIKRDLESRGVIFYSRKTGAPVMPSVELPENLVDSPCWKAWAEHQIREGVFATEETLKRWWETMRKMNAALVSLQSDNPARRQEAVTVFNREREMLHHWVHRGMRANSPFYPVPEFFAQTLEDPLFKESLVGLSSELNLSQFDLSGLDLSHADWRGVNLRSCCLIGVNWDEAILPPEGKLEFCWVESTSRLQGILHSLNFNQHGQASGEIPYLETEFGPISYLEMAMDSAFAGLESLKDRPLLPGQEIRFNLEKKAIVDRFNDWMRRVTLLKQKEPPSLSVEWLHILTDSAVRGKISYEDEEGRTVGLDLAIVKWSSPSLRGIHEVSPDKKILDLTGYSFLGMDLTDSDLTGGLILHDADFRDAKTAGCKMPRDLKGVKFWKEDLETQLMKLQFDQGGVIGYRTLSELAGGDLAKAEKILKSMGADLVSRNSAASAPPPSVTPEEVRKFLETRLRSPRPHEIRSLTHASLLMKTGFLTWEKLTEGGEDSLLAWLKNALTDNGVAFLVRADFMKQLFAPGFLTFEKLTEGGEDSLLTWLKNVCEKESGIPTELQVELITRFFASGLLTFENLTEGGEESILAWLKNVLEKHKGYSVSPTFAKQLFASGLLTFENLTEGGEESILAWLKNALRNETIISTTRKELIIQFFSSGLLTRENLTEGEEESILAWIKNTLADNGIEKDVRMELAIQLLASGLLTRENLTEGGGESLLAWIKNALAHRFSGLLVRVDLVRQLLASDLLTFENLTEGGEQSLFDWLKNDLNNKHAMPHHSLRKFVEQLLASGLLTRENLTKGEEKSILAWLKNTFENETTCHLVHMELVIQLLASGSLILKDLTEGEEEEFLNWIKNAFADETVNTHTRLEFMKQFFESGLLTWEKLTEGQNFLAWIKKIPSDHNGNNIRVRLATALLTSGFLTWENLTEGGEQSFLAWIKNTVAHKAMNSDDRLRPLQQLFASGLLTREKLTEGGEKSLLAWIKNTLEDTEEFSSVRRALATQLLDSGLLTREKLTEGGEKSLLAWIKNALKADETDLYVRVLLATQLLDSGLLTWENLTEGGDQNLLAWIKNILAHKTANSDVAMEPTKQLFASGLLTREKLTEGGEQSFLAWIKKALAGMQNTVRVPFVKQLLNSGLLTWENLAEGGENSLLSWILTAVESFEPGVPSSIGIFTFDKIEADLSSLIFEVAKNELEKERAHLATKLSPLDEKSRAAQKVFLATPADAVLPKPSMAAIPQWVKKEKIAEEDKVEGAVEEELFYTGSGGRIRYTDEGGKRFLEVDGVHCEVRDAGEAEKNREHFLVPTNRHIESLSSLILDIRDGRITRYTGPPGTGKSATPEDLAARLGLPFFSKTMHGLVSEGDLFGAFELTEDGYRVTSGWSYGLSPEQEAALRKRFQATSPAALEALLDEKNFEELRELGVRRTFDSQFLDFYFNGGLYCFDEGPVGAASQSLLDSLARILSGKAIHLNKHPGQPGKKISKNPLFHVATTENPDRRPLSAFFLAHCRTQHVDNDYSDEELSSILASIYKQGAARLGLSAERRPRAQALFAELIRRQVKTHRSVLSVLAHHKDAERMDRLYQYGLRELRFAALDILEAVRESDFDSPDFELQLELAFVTKTFAAYVKHLRSEQEKKAVLQAVQRHFGRVEREGSALLSRLEDLLRGVQAASPALGRDLEKSWVLVRYFQSRSDEQFAELAGTIASLGTAEERAEAWLALLKVLFENGFEKDAEGVLKHLKREAAQIPSVEERDFLLDRVSQVLGKRWEFDLDLSLIADALEAWREELQKELPAPLSEFRKLLWQLEKILAGGPMPSHIRALLESILPVLNVEMEALYPVIQRLHRLGLYDLGLQLFFKPVKSRIPYEGVYTLGDHLPWMRHFPETIPPSAFPSWGEALEALLAPETSEADREKSLRVLLFHGCRTESKKDERAPFLLALMENWDRFAPLEASDPSFRSVRLRVLKYLMASGDFRAFQNLQIPFSTEETKELFASIFSVPFFAWNDFLLWFMSDSGGKLPEANTLYVDGWTAVFVELRRGFRNGNLEAPADLRQKLEQASVFNPQEDWLEEEITDKDRRPPWRGTFSDWLRSQIVFGTLEGVETWAFFSQNAYRALERIETFARGAARTRKMVLEEPSILDLDPEADIDDLDGDYSLTVALPEPATTSDPTDTPEPDELASLSPLPDLRLQALERKRQSASSSPPAFLQAGLDAFQTALAKGDTDSMRNQLLTLQKKLLENKTDPEFHAALSRYADALSRFLLFLKRKGKNLVSEAQALADLNLFTDFSKLVEIRDLGPEEKSVSILSVLTLLQHLVLEQDSAGGEFTKRLSDALYFLGLEKERERALPVARAGDSIHIADLRLRHGGEIPDFGSRPDYVPRIFSEDQAIRNIAEGISSKPCTISIVESGARMEVILDTLCREIGYRRVTLEGTRYRSVESFFGGVRILDETDLETRQELVSEPGLLTRYMVEKDGRGNVPLSGESVLIDIPNFQEIPADARSALYKLLQNGYEDVQVQGGAKKRLYLPANVRLHFQIPSDFDEAFESAIFSRTEKVFVPALDAGLDADLKRIRDTAGQSELERVVMAVHGLSASEANDIRLLQDLLTDLDEREAWEGGARYAFNADDAFEMAVWAKAAIHEEAERQGLSPRTLPTATRQNLLRRELRRYALNRIRSEDRPKVEACFDEENFLLLEPETLPPYRLDRDGYLVEILGVPVPVNRDKAVPYASWPKEFRNYDLELVESLALPASAILRSLAPRAGLSGKAKPGRAVLSIGNSSMGKTTLAGFLSLVLGQDAFYVYSTDGQSEESNLTLEYEPNAHAGKISRDGSRISARFASKVQKFLEAFERGDTMVMIDEVNLKGDLLAFFTRIAKGAEEILVDVPGSEPRRVRRGKNLLVQLSMNESEEGVFGGRGILKSHLRQEFVPVYFPERYTLSEQYRIQSRLTGHQHLEEETPEDWAELVHHGVPGEAAPEPDTSGGFEEAVLKALEEGTEHPLRVLKQALLALQDENIRVSVDTLEQTVQKIVNALHAKNVFHQAEAEEGTSEAEKEEKRDSNLKICAEFLRARLEHALVQQALQKHRPKLEKVERAIRLMLRGTPFADKIVVVVGSGQSSSFDEARGILTLHYAHVEELGARKLLGIARHEVNHALFTRLADMQKTSADENAPMEVKLFAKRLFRFPKFFRPLNIFEDAVIDHASLELNQPFHKNVWELRRYLFGKPYSVSAYAAEGPGLLPGGALRLDPDDSPGYRRLRSSASLYQKASGREEMGWDSSRVTEEQYLEQAAETPHETYIWELFYFFYNGQHTPYFERLKKQENLKEIHDFVLRSQDEFLKIVRQDSSLRELDGKDLTREESRVRQKAVVRLQSLFGSRHLLPLYLELFKRSLKDVEELEKFETQIQSFEQTQDEWKRTLEQWTREALKSVALEKGMKPEELSPQDDDVLRKVAEKRRQYEAEIQNELETQAETFQKDLEEDPEVTALKEELEKLQNENLKTRAERAEREENKELGKAVDRLVDEEKEFLKEVQDWVDGQTKTDKGIPTSKPLDPNALKEALKNVLKKYLETEKAKREGLLDPEEEKLSFGQGGGSLEEMLQDYLRRAGKSTDVGGRSSTQDPMKEALQNQLNRLLGKTKDSLFNRDPQPQAGGQGQASTASSQAGQTGSDQSAAGEQASGETQTESRGSGEGEEEDAGEEGAGEESDEGRSPKDGDLSSQSIQKAIQEAEAARKARQRTEKPGDGEDEAPGEGPEGQKKPNGTPTRTQDPLSTQPQGQNPGDARERIVREALKGKDGESDPSRIQSLLGQIESHLSRPARRWAKKLRDTLLNQMKQDFETVMTRSGGKFSLLDYIRMKSRFFEKLFVQETVETMDVDILIDMSGSIQAAADSLSSLAVYMTRQLGDLGDVGINFRIRGFGCPRENYEKDGIHAKNNIVEFRNWLAPGQTVKPEDLAKMYDSMKNELGNGGGQNFHDILENSRQELLQRKKKAKARHRLVFLVSDGLDYRNAPTQGADGRWKSDNPLLEGTLARMEQDGIPVIGVGVGYRMKYQGVEIDPLESSHFINMLPAWVNLGTEFDRIGEVVFHVLSSVAEKGKGAVKKLKGDLRRSFPELHRNHPRPGQSPAKFTTLDLETTATLMAALDRFSGSPKTERNVSLLAQALIPHLPQRAVETLLQEALAGQFPERNRLASLASRLVDPAA